MNFLQFDLGSVKAGETVIVTLDKQANGRMMDQIQFDSFRAVKRYSFSVSERPVHPFVSRCRATGIGPW